MGKSSDGDRSILVRRVGSRETSIGRRNRLEKFSGDSEKDLSRRRIDRADAAQSTPVDLETSVVGEQRARSLVSIGTSKRGKASFSFDFRFFFRSWESVFLRSTNRLSEVELNCCYRFVELCQESLFILYRYSLAQSCRN